MTPQELDRALREVITRTGEVAKSPVASPDLRTVAAAVALLATVVGHLLKDEPPRTLFLTTA